ncbi:MAG: hypothetical protein LBB74_06700 [Chitinispirillales bacterium]|jgi:hypothetical protein|nr:hypothetical protein [Chitinispirillales bacterium]
MKNENLFQNIPFAVVVFSTIAAILMMYEKLFLNVLFAILTLSIVVVILIHLAKIEQERIDNLKNKYEKWCNTLQNAAKGINESMNIKELVTSVGKLKTILDNYDGYKFLASGRLRIGDFIKMLDEQYARMNNFGNKMWNNIWNPNRKTETLKTDIINRISEVSNKSWEQSEKEINIHIQINNVIWIIWAMVNTFLFSISCYLLSSSLGLSQ